MNRGAGFYAFLVAALLVIGIVIRPLGVDKDQLSPLLSQNLTNQAQEETLRRQVETIKNLEANNRRLQSDLESVQHRPQRPASDSAPQEKVVCVSPPATSVKTPTSAADLSMEELVAQAARSPQALDELVQLAKTAQAKQSRKLVDGQFRVHRHKRGGGQRRPIKRSNLASNSDTTGPGIPNAFRQLLTHGLTDGVTVNESAADFYGARAAVVKLESMSGGWDVANTKLTDGGPMLRGLGVKEGAPFDVPGIGPGPAVSGVSSSGDGGDPTPLITDLEHKAWDEIDIILPTIRDTRVFFEKWKPFMRGYHVIIIQDGTPAEIAARAPIEIPDWVNYELYDRESIIETLGIENHDIISMKDASVRNFGFLVSRKKYVFSIDDDVYPARDNKGQLINAITQHVNNLRSNSTPYMFNTLFDPYRHGGDFVRGYPFSLRQGIPTAVSHGLWLSTPDYDAPTQLLKPLERNTIITEVAITVPYGQLYPLCSMNVAFNRELIGPALMQGLMGTGQPLGRYDDMFSGWASKVVADHLGLGSKNGAPMIWHNKASNPFRNLEKEYKGLFWQEDITDWFHHDALVGSQCASSSECYRELAVQLRRDLSYLHPEFIKRLARAMEVWTKAWDDAEKGTLRIAKPKRVGAAHGRDMAIFVLVKDEPAYLPAWLRHYRPWFPDRDIWIVDGNSTDGSIEASTKGMPEINIHRYDCGSYFDHHCLNRKAEQIARHLMNDLGYRRVVMTEADEWFVAKGGLRKYLCGVNKPFVRADGWHPYETAEQAASSTKLDWSKPIIPQRLHGIRSLGYCKTLVLTTPRIRWWPGFHNIARVPVDEGDDVMQFPGKSPAENGLPPAFDGNGYVGVDTDLVLYHAKNIDQDFFLRRILKQKTRKDWNKVDAEAGMGLGALVLNKEESAVNKQNLDLLDHLRGASVPFPPHIAEWEAIPATHAKCSDLL